MTTHPPQEQWEEEMELAQKRVDDIKDQFDENLRLTSHVPYLNTPDTEGGCCKGCKTATNKSEWDKGNVYCSNRECKCHTPETESSKDLTTAEQSHTSVKQNLDTTPDTEWEKEKLAEQLHEWYLEATYQEDAKYNIDAVVPYNDLPEGSKILDRYIAGKIIEMLTSRDTYWKERVRNMVDKKKIVVEDGPLDVDEVYYNKACDDILQALDNLK